MIELTTLHEALVGEIRDLYGAEKQLLKALARMAPAARTATVRDVVALLLTDTSNQLWRLEEIFGLLDEDITSRHCLGMARILDSRRDVPSYKHAGAADAVVALTAQRAAHYLLAVYSTAAARARALGYFDVAQLLHESLDEATATGQRLLAVAPVTASASLAAEARG